MKPNAAVTIKDVALKGALFGFLLFGCFSAYAEYAVLRAADSYCRAEVRIGAYGSGNPEDLSLVYSGSAKQGQKWAGGEGQRVCGRRSGYGPDCNSSATNWVCISPYKDLNYGAEVSGEF